MRRVRIAAFALSITGLMSLAIWFVAAQGAFAHCDTLDGPVVADARAALEKADVTPVLKWVSGEYEAEVRAAFDRAVVVRGKGPEAKDLADMYFFETLVRVHRAGEGAPYTGLKAAGSVEPVVAAADAAIANGSADELVKEVTDVVAGGIRERFERVMNTKPHAAHTVEMGREYVEAYVEFIHYVERLHTDATGAAAHGEAAGGEGAHGQ